MYSVILYCVLLHTDVVLLFLSFLGFVVTSHSVT